MDFAPDVPDPAHVEDLAHSITTYLSRRFDLSFTYLVNPLGHELGSEATHNHWSHAPHLVGYEVSLYAAPKETVRENARSVPIGSIYIAESPLVHITHDQFRDATRKFLTGR